MYKINAVSKLLDMPSVTIRSWETRYHAITPKRTESGHRIYTEENINDLRWLKKQVYDNKMNISQAVELLTIQKEKGTSDQRQAVDHSHVQSFDMQVDELYHAVLQFDSEKCHQLFDLYFSQFHYRTVFYSIIVPLMYKVGDAWEQGKLSVIKEHMISNIIHQRAMSFFNLFQPSPVMPKVLAICPEGEQHQIGLILYTLFLKEQHYPVYYIGANTPLEGLDALIKEKDITIVTISISSEEHEVKVQHYIETLSKLNPKIKFVVGGLGIKNSRSQDPRWDVSPSEKDWNQHLNQINQLL